MTKEPFSVVFDSTNHKPDSTKKLFTLIGLFVVIIFIYTKKGYFNFSGFSRTEFYMFLFALVFVPFIWWLFFYKKAHQKFTLTEQGINFGNKHILWQDIKGFHLLGESQSERIGVVSVPIIGFDPININANDSIYVIKLRRIFFQTKIRVRVAPDKVDEFKRYLNENGVSEQSKLRLWIGLN